MTKKTMLHRHINDEHLHMLCRYLHSNQRACWRPYQVGKQVGTKLENKLGNKRTRQDEHLGEKIGFKFLKFKFRGLTPFLFLSGEISPPHHKSSF